MADLFDNPERWDELPELRLDLKITEINAPTRKLMKRRRIDIVERLAAIADGKPDPGEWVDDGPLLVDCGGPDPGILFHPKYGEPREPQEPTQ